MPGLYKPHRLPHQMLAVVAGGWASTPQIFARLGNPDLNAGNVGRKLCGLLHDDLIRTSGNGWEITAIGSEVLERLNAGEEVMHRIAEPSVRVFAREAA